LLKAERGAGGECSHLNIGICRQLLFAKSANRRHIRGILRSFPGLARSLISHVHRPASKQAGEKRRVQMSSQSPFTRTLVAIAAALTMSTIAVGAAVGPASANANPVEVSVNA
jgi:hypothetical protein